MNHSPTILGCFAHPDDEILGPGGAFAHYAFNGADVQIVCATRGEAGEIADPSLATEATLPQVREAELRCSAQTLGVSQVHFLDYRDSGMADSPENDHPEAFVNIPQEEVVAKLVKIIRRVQPHLIITFEPYGGYGHPDHIAIHKATLAAFDAAADPDYHPEWGRPWQTRRLFYPIVRRAFFKGMKERMSALGLDVSDFEEMETRREKSWPDDKFHAILDVTDMLEAKYNAFLCHRTQFGGENFLRRLPPEELKSLLTHEYFALAKPEPPEGMELHDLFEGIVDGS